MELIKKYIKDNLWILSSYAGVGAGTAIGYLCLYVILIEYFFLTPFWSAVFGYLPGLVIGYLLTYYWVFKSLSNHLETSIKYIIVNGLGYLVNILGIYITINIYLLNYLFAQLLVFLVVAIHNYTLNFVWTFSKEKNKGI